MALTFDHLTLSVCSASGVTWSNSAQNLSKIEKSAAELFASSLGHTVIKTVMLTLDPLTLNVSTP